MTTPWPSRSCWRRREDSAYLAPHFVYAVRREAAELLDGEELLDTGGLRIITTLDYEGYQVSAEKWAQVAYDLDRLTDEELVAKYGEAALAWIAPAAGSQHQQRRHRDRQLPNRGRARLRRQCQLLRRVDARQHQPNYRRPRPGVPPVRARPSSRSPTPPASRPGTITPASMFMDVEGEIVDGYERPERRRARARSRAGARRPEVLAQRPGQQGAAAHRHRQRRRPWRASSAWSGTRRTKARSPFPRSPWEPSACTSTRPGRRLRRRSPTAGGSSSRT